MAEKTTKWAKGQSGNPKGRTPGSKNILTKTVKENLVAAFDGAGGVEKFTEWAKKNPAAFYPLYCKMLPLEVSGEDGGGLVIQIVKLGEQ